MRSVTLAILAVVALCACGATLERTAQVQTRLESAVVEAQAEFAAGEISAQERDERIAAAAEEYGGALKALGEGFDWRGLVGDAAAILIPALLGTAGAIPAVNAVRDRRRRKRGESVKVK